ncbi:MAG: hypothetical protein JSS41_08360 [Proteobacteria bacterium]|nr:hypothetical protein [Pseudomonadota bacterium]
MIEHGEPITPELLSKLSPFRTQHINCFGGYLVDLERKRLRLDCARAERQPTIAATQKTSPIQKVRNQMAVFLTIPGRPSFPCPMPETFPSKLRSALRSSGNAGAGVAGHAACMFWVISRVATP